MLQEESQPIEQDTSAEPSSKYRCVLRLDSGGMAEVFLAVSQGPVGFNKLFVLKRLREALAENHEHREMFLHEARLAARLNHPNVVQTYEVGEDGTGIFIAMEYLEGQPLSRIRREVAKRGMEIPHAIHVRIASEVLGGLHYAHEVADYDGTPLRIVHRDVSPQNVFVTYDGQVKIVDFGIAKTHDSGTQAGIFKGKFAYTAPEQLRGEAIDRRADVFTAGIVLWEMLTGEKLLAGENPAQTLSRLLNEPIPNVASLVPDVDPRLDAIVMRALERNPANRYQTAQAMRDALEEFLVVAGLSVRQDQIARLLGDLFRTERARVQKAIKEEIATWIHSPSSSRVVAASRLPLSLSDDSVSLRRLGTQGVLRSMMAVGAADDAPDVQVVAPSRRIDITRRRIAVAVLALGACGAIGYGISSRRSAGADVPTASTNPGAPTAPTTTATTSGTGGDPQTAGSATSIGAGATTGAGTGTATGSGSVTGPGEAPEEAATVKIAGAAPKWMPHPKKATNTSGASASTTSPPVIATPTPPPQAPTTETTGQKEKRKFRLDL